MAADFTHSSPPSRSRRRAVNRTDHRGRPEATTASAPVRPHEHVAFPSPSRSPAETAAPWKRFRTRSSRRTGRSGVPPRNGFRPWLLSIVVNEAHNVAARTAARAVGGPRRRATSTRPPRPRTYPWSSAKRQRLLSAPWPSFPTRIAWCSHPLLRRAAGRRGRRAGGNPASAYRVRCSARDGGFRASGGADD